MGRFQAANRALTCLSGHSATTITRQLSCTDAACAGSVPRPLAASPAVAAAAQLLLLRPLPTAWHTAAGGQHQHTLWAGNHAWRDWNSCTPRRSFATDNHEALRVVHADISEQQFHALADATLDHLQETLEVFVEDQDVDGADVEHAQGVLTVKLGQAGTYVINKQTPNRQIWLSSPVSGPFRYDWHDGHWVYHRDGRELLSQLQAELQQLLGHAPDLTTGGSGSGHR